MFTGAISVLSGPILFLGNLSLAVAAWLTGVSLN